MNYITIIFIIMNYIIVIILHRKATIMYIVIFLKKNTNQIINYW